MRHIKNYVKESPGKNGVVTTSVSIEASQKEFVLKNKLNLSKICRDAVTSIMQGAKRAG